MALSVTRLHRGALRVPRVGTRLFSIVFCLRAPYVRTIRPLVTDLRPHNCTVRVAKRWSVTNHLGTVHTIAVCNGLEAAAGLLAQATTPSGKRWITTGMTVRYTAKVDSDVVCVAETAPGDWVDTGDVPIRVRATRRDGTVVTEGTITIRVSERPT
jgi:acyl-coenzyme A thioesterase PaaI-like protein